MSLPNHACNAWTHTKRIWTCKGCYTNMFYVFLVAFCTCLSNKTIRMWVFWGTGRLSEHVSLPGNSKRGEKWAIDHAAGMNIKLRTFFRCPCTVYQIDKSVTLVPAPPPPRSCFPLRLPPPCPPLLTHSCLTLPHPPLSFPSFCNSHICLPLHPFLPSLLAALRPRLYTLGKGIIKGSVLTNPKIYTSFPRSLLR